MRSHTPKGRLARERIVAAAEELFAERGFHGTSIRDVADAADVPLATAVYHFAKKEQLYAAVLGEIGAALEDGIRLAAAIPDPLAALDAAIGIVIRWAADEPRRVTLLVRELLDNPGRVGRAAKLPLAPVLVTTAELIARGRAAGVLASDEPPETLALHVLGGISYFVAARPTLRRIAGREREGDLAKTWERDALAFARRALGAPDKEKQHGTAEGARPRGARARARRSADDRP